MKKNLLNRKYFLLLASCFLCSISFAQQSAGSLADEMFANGEYYTAAKLYEQALSGKSKNKKSSFHPYFVHTSGKRTIKVAPSDTARMIWNTAESYRMIHDPENAEHWYARVAQNNSAAYPLAKYRLGQSLRANQKYAEAETALQQFISAYPTYNEYKKDAQRELANLAFIKSHSQINPAYSIAKITHPLSTQDGYFSAVMNKNDLVFTSVYTDSAAMKKQLNPYKDRLFIGSLADAQITSQQLMNIENIELNKQQGTPTFFDNGTKMYLTQWENQNGKLLKKIYFSAQKNNVWSKPAEVTVLNAEGYSSMQPCVTADGKYVLFSSDRPGGYGKNDIWYAPMADNSVAGMPVNAGSMINTSENEEAPFYAAEYQTMVFSSDGRIGFGGLDFYTSLGDLKKMSEPENLGTPFNSSKDDVYFFVKNDQQNNRSALISSDRSSGCCLELYNVKMNALPKNSTFIIKDCTGGSMITSAIMYKTKGNNFPDSIAADVQGNIKSPIPAEDIGVKISAQNYTTTDFVIKKMTPGLFSSPDEFSATIICLDKLPSTPAVSTGNENEPDLHVYFDFDRSSLDASAKESLDLLADQMKQHPDWTIEIGGYTDENGSEKYNLALGYRRGKAAADYLKRKGVEPKRMSIHSYGKCCPLENVPNDPQHRTDRANRRLGFIFFKK